jgi:hypothetical protein
MEPSPDDPRLEEVDRKIDEVREEAEETGVLDDDDEPRFADPGEVGPVDDAIAPG